MFERIFNIGIKEKMSLQLKRKLKTTNVVIVILIGLAILLLVPFFYEDGWSISTKVTIASILLFIFLLGLNYLGYNKISRVITVIYPSFGTMATTLFIKHSYPEMVSPFDFIDARIIMISFLLLAFMLFSFKEKALLFSTISFSYILVIAFDPIHHFFGVGYSRFFGVMPKEYIATGMYIDYAMLFLTGSFYYFKANIENVLVKNVSLSADLGEKNVELSALFEVLENTNLELADQVEAKTIELRQSNDELVNHNNDLQQFSNTLSHNLRGPVANLLGLAQLFKADKTEDSRTQVAEHIFKSATTLDDVIKDLNKVIDLRNNLHQIKEKIDIKKEIEDIWFVLDQNIKQCNGKLILDIKVPVLYGIRSYFNSVLYNIISNAIKYCHANRDCIIRISTYKENDTCLIRVTDNGIGIDLEKYGDKLFGMYKRFHDHVDGKGLGLFLTKQQVEAMHGKILVKSQLDTGTQFTIELPSFPLAQIESQLFYSSDIANVYLDAINGITTLLWKKMPNPLEFRDVFKKNIEIFKAYNSDLWIVDLSLMINRSAIEKQWVMEEAIDQYVTVGIKKVAVIRTVNGSDIAFWEDFYNACKRKSIDIIYSENIHEAKEKLLNL